MQYNFALAQTVQAYQILNQESPDGTYRGHTKHHPLNWVLLGTNDDAAARSPEICETLPCELPGWKVSG